MSRLLLLSLLLAVVRGLSFRFSKPFGRGAAQVAARHAHVRQSGWRRLGQAPRAEQRLMMSTATPSVIPTDEEMEAWLQDMMYSGDLLGFVRRRARDVVTLDFVEYVEERLELCQDEDEKGVLSEIFGHVSNKLKETEGLVDSGVVFEKRLDSILFCAPNKRAELIKGIMLEEMSPAFIDYVQGQLKDTTDTDGKVVLASILQLIGQAKGGDYLGGAAAMLSLADASLGDQFKKAEGELDFGATGGVVETKALGGVGDRNEQMLASLMFSQNDILEDVLNNLHEIDDRFCKFLQDKLDKTKDIEERSGLQSLLDTVTVVLDRVKEAQSEGGAGAAVDEELTMEQVKQRMQEVQMGAEVSSKSGGKEQKAFTVQKDKKDSFQSILRRFTGLADEEAVEQAVQANYELCDMEFMEMLKSEADACFVEGADAEGKQYNDLIAVIMRVMASRIDTAQQKLQRILSKRGVKAMESEVVAMVRKGEVDEALTLLIETNAQQADKAGAKQAADVLRTLLKRISTEQERKLPDEQRLLRALLRQPDSEKRKELIYAGFKPVKSMNPETGNMVEGAPLISPPAFINMARQFILNFGNVEKMDIMGRVQIIIDEAQIVATELYGEGMNPRQQQKFMFDKQTVSVWDLANFEDMAMMSGEEVPWRNDAWDNKSPEEGTSRKQDIPSLSLFHSESDPDPDPNSSLSHTNQSSESACGKLVERIATSCNCF